MATSTTRVKASPRTSSRRCHGGARPPRRASSRPNSNWVARYSRGAARIRTIARRRNGWAGPPTRATPRRSICSARCIAKDGAPQDPERGRDWLARAAAQGHSDALRLLHFFVDVGEDTAVVYEQSGEELKRRAGEGDVEAQYQLALRYETGAWGVPRNDREALKWFTRAAEDAPAPPSGARALSRANDRDG
ncbi:MAG: hypothetical protein AMS22_17555 [Thiotrichales bacterium SG8_50]|nr:MAG: hypothetical protein AMS22_17555 [Thiotrichales bacterium SG8_50]